jgi:acyl-[acyl-carrier-protein]-phospholipid O-acyltransferase/long-chain-fatty-acid--[acyl-carrier-protein] ligase
MVLIVTIALVMAAAYAAMAILQMLRLGISAQQALLYVPLKLVYRIHDWRMRDARKIAAPVIYAVTHQSRLDPALMLALLPDDTLHILDEASAKSPWLEPWRVLARTIAFNAKHVFLSRRLVRFLKGGGRLAVYLPDNVEPDVNSYRLFRAVARMAVQADAKIVPIFIGGARHLPFSLSPATKAPRRLFPGLSISVLEPMTIQQLMERPDSRPSNALFDRLAEARLAATDPDRSLFLAVRDAAARFKPWHPIVEDPIAGILSYRRLFVGARILGQRFASLTAPAEAVGVLLPNSNAMVLTLLGLASGSRVAAMINHKAGPASVTSAVRTAVIRTVVSSRAFVQKGDLAAIVEAAEKGGAKFIWLEDLRQSVTIFDRLAAMVSWRRPIHAQNAAKPAVILFTSGSEGNPKAVVLSSRNLVANAMQVEARIAFGPDDKLLNVLPAFHSFGLTGGTLLPLLTGVRLFLYPSPLHTKLIPEIAAKIQPTVMFGTDTFLAAYARAAKDGDFASLRFAVAGAEPVRAETRRIWRERFGVEIIEGYGLTEAAPVVSVNTATHGREGTAGRPLPGIRVRLEPIKGIREGGRLLLQGPNLMMGYMMAEKPGILQPLGDSWHDSGDVVSTDREGFLTIRGRAKRFAKIAGEMVSLGAVEMLVHSLWPEESHAVVALPDKRKGERIALLTTAADTDISLIRQFSRLSGASELMVPHDIVKVDAIPTLGSGKIDYVTARRMVMEQLGTEAAA